MNSTTNRGLKAILTTTAVVAAGIAVMSATAVPAAAAPAAQAPTMDVFLRTQLLDVHDFWTRFQSRVGGPDTSVNYVFPLPGAPYQTWTCGASDDNSMFYCPGDDLVVFSQDLAVRLWEGQYQTNHTNHAGKVAGDFAVALMVAHEYAHNVQQEVGIRDAGHQSINTELHADCWAGVWMNDSFYADELQGTDVEEAAAVMERLGDDEGPYTHGSPEQRAYAFQYGYDSGVPAACDDILLGTWLEPAGH